MRKIEKEGLIWFEAEEVYNAQDPVGLSQKVQHGFFSRVGGVSSGPYASLNVGGTDDPDHIQENLRRISGALNVPEASIHLLTQVHGAESVWVREGQKEATEGDALITQERGQVLSVLTADCLPVAVMDAEGEGVAMIHAGWRGLQAGIIPKTLDKMREKGMAHFVVVIGPSIFQKNYEVHAGLYEVFLSLGSEYAAFFKPVLSEADKYWADLPGICAHQLRGQGVQDIYQIPLDTYEEEALFFSCRRAAHKDIPFTFGRQLSFVMLT